MNPGRKRRNDRILIAGCGRLGAWLANQLSCKGYQVIIVDINKSEFDKLPEDYSGFEINGDATDIDLLRSLDMEDAFMLVSVTGDDNTNSLIAQIASRLLHVERVITRFNDIEHASLVSEFNIDIIAPFALSVSEFERLSGIRLQKEDDE